MGSQSDVMSTEMQKSPLPKKDRVSVTETQKNGYLPLVSTIIPTVIGREDLLERACISVKQQTYPNIEIIIVKEGLSAPEQRNVGIARAQGDFIAFLDDDDEWLPEKIERQMAIMERHPECPLVICHSLDLRFGKRRVSSPPKVIDYGGLIKSFNLSSTSSYLCRKEYLDSVCGFDTSFRSAQEYDLALQLSMVGDGLVRCVPEVLMVQHSSKDQISENWGRKIGGILNIYRKYGHEYRLIDHAKTVGLLIFFFLGYLFGNRIYRVLIPLKTLYEALRMGR